MHQSLQKRLLSRFRKQLILLSSKTVHSAVSKVDQARSKFQAAVKARQNLHDRWSTYYLEQSIARWKGFAEDFGNKDKDLEEKAIQAREALQQARSYLDRAKEIHSRQDAAVLEATTEIVSNDDESIRSRRQRSSDLGIEKVVESLETIRVCPAPA